MTGVMIYYHGVVLGTELPIACDKTLLYLKTPIQVKGHRSDVKPIRFLSFLTHWRHPVTKAGTAPKTISCSPILDEGADRQTKQS